MDEMLHYPTCRVWMTNEAITCNCRPMTADWVIREDPTQQFPWRIFRCTSDGEQEVMGCSTIGKAAALVEGFAWLKNNCGQLRRNSDA